jgi:hypothetical protein
MQHIPLSLFCRKSHLTNIFLHTLPTPRSIESVQNILDILRNTSHNGFPVWAHQTDLEADGPLEVGAGDQGAGAGRQGCTCHVA